MSDINFCNTKEQLNHLGEVVTGKVDGSPTGADIDTSTLPYTGQVRKTLPALEGEYEQSITDKEAEADAAIDAYRLLNKGPYAPGITLEDKFQYITYNGGSYFAVSPPYTTTATTPESDPDLMVGSYASTAYVDDGLGDLKKNTVNCVTTLSIKDSDLTGVKCVTASSYSNVFDVGSASWVSTGVNIPANAGVNHLIGSIYVYDSEGNQFKSVDQQLHNVGVIASESVDHTQACQRFFSEIDSKRTVEPLEGTYLLDVGSQTAPLTDGTDPSRCAVLLGVPVTIKGRGVFKALDGSGVLANNNYMFSTATEGVRLRSANIDGNRDNVNSSYGVQINNNDTIVTDWSRFTDLDGSPVVVNGVDAQNPLTDIVIPNNIAENCANTVFVGFCKDIIGHTWKVHNASEGLDLDKRCEGGNFSGWVISTFRGSGADAALEINGGKGIQADGWVSIDFVRGILLNGKEVDGVQYRSENCSTQNHTIINPTGHAITVGTALGGDDDAVDCNCDGYTIINASIAALATRGKNCSFRNGKIRGGLREGILHQGGTCYYDLTEINDVARQGILVSSGYAGCDGVTVKESGSESSGVYDAVTFVDGSSGSVLGLITGGASHQFSLRCLGSVDLRFGDVDLNGGTMSDDVKISSGTNLFNMRASTEGGLSFRNSAREFEALEAFTPSSGFAPKIGDTIIHTDTDPAYYGRRWNGSSWKSFGAFV